MEQNNKQISIMIPKSWEMTADYRRKSDRKDAEENYGIKLTFDRKVGLTVQGTEDALESFLDDFTDGDKGAAWFLLRQSGAAISEALRQSYADNLEVSLDQLDTMDLSEYAG